MADVSHIVTLGIGTPADLPHFVLVGLSVNPSVAEVSVVTVEGRASYQPRVALRGSTQSAHAGRASTRTSHRGRGSV